MSYCSAIWLKLLALVIYLFILFVIARIIETASWYDGILARRILDPFALSVRKLKSLLDARGISYTGIVELKELTQLVQTSGEIIEGELEEAEESETSSETYFTCGTHFYEEVEDTKDSIWLVQVVSPNKNNILDSAQWNQLKKKVSHFGVRTGSFNCALDKRLCLRKSWYSSRLVLALPYGQKAKDNVVIHSYAGSVKTSAIFKWVNEQLSFQTKQVASLYQLKNDWLHYDSNLKHSEVRVLLVSNLPEPPMFLSALSVKFTGRIKFGYVRPSIYQDYLHQYSQKQTWDQNTFSPLILIITPEEILKYGVNRGEHLNYKTMEFYLKTFKPEVNDIFLGSLTLINIIGFMELFLVSGVLWRFAKTLWILGKYNSALILFWLILLGLLQFSFIGAICEIALKVLRLVSRSSIAVYWRKDYHYYNSHIALLLLPLLPVGLLLNWLKIFRLDENGEERNGASWWNGFDLDISSYLFRPTSQTVNRPMGLSEFDLEGGVEFLIERLAVPNFWLQPIIPDYLKNLPVWSYEGPINEDRYGNFDSSGSDGGIENPISLSKVQNDKECQLLNQKNYVCEMKHDTNCNEGHTTNTDVKANSGKKKVDINISKTNHVCETHRPNLSSLTGNRNSELKNQNSNFKTRNVYSKKSNKPLGMHECHECAICLENFEREVILCGLPCGHFYHHYCLMKWLATDNHVCPICRWPAYKSKKDLFHLHSE